MSRKSYNIAGHVHYLTFSCYHRQHLLTDNKICPWLIENINNSRATEDFELYAYVIMPEHVHLLIHPRNPNYTISQILRRIKEPFTRRVVAYWRENSPKQLDRLRANFGSRVIHRFWQPGGGYDRNLYSLDAVNRAITYIEFNPVRRGLVQEPKEWLWSSAYEEQGEENVILRINEANMADWAIKDGA